MIQHKQCCEKCRENPPSGDNYCTAKGCDCHTPQHKQPTWREQQRQKIEKVLWEHYNDGGYAMNGEQASQEIMAVLNGSFASLISQLEGEEIPHKECYLDRCGRCESPAGFRAGIHAAIALIRQEYLQ